ncbi:response regulator [Venenivibrio stagnispumantis]|uniref:Two-component system, OmpR family, alkaline phosphatase synthesis response regulator PhoP n=1 Tax=Venenivibrio stagnispumantis TaxID=407998 RepID=A0AA45WL81_9AQUI|nr:response regulator transcription factor [Venenivibrio stagnispumantis]MCW4573689.1 response regulator transcription factor [Venenivibrio stagnispumantis]SMP10009.1 two-component system, OmpR family, alkaline phosphatase synthesis response regulator PhoP [Venenivibrio stagnispumantis]
MANLVFVVEDDRDINDLLTYNLRKEGYEVKPFLSSRQALEELKNIKPDIILLDVMLPDIDGLEFCKIVKSNKNTEKIPIIMITAKGTEIDKIVGLELGADDYITKPFSIREVIARIKTVLRRYKYSTLLQSPTIKFKDLEIIPEKFEVRLKNEKLNITTTQLKLLIALITANGRVLSRDYILNNVWNEEKDVYDRTIDVHIKHLRDSLKDYGKFIKTVRGIGYRWSCDED